MRGNIERSHGDEYRASRLPEDPDSAYDYVRKHGPRWLRTAHKFLLTELIVHEPIGQVLVNMIWAVLDLSGDPFSLLTSDGPYATSHGLLLPQCVLRVPISPTRLFVTANHVVQLEALARRTKKDIARECNDIVARMAVDNVYGLNDAQRAFVETRLRKRGQAPVPGGLMQGR